MVSKLIYLIVFLSAFYSNVVAQGIQRGSLFDMDWKFYRGKLVGAENPNFDDKTWRDFTIPHHWSREDLPVANTSDKIHIISEPFDSKAINGKNSGFTVGGTGCIEGNGKIVAVGNSNPTSVESFQQPTRKAFEGKCLVIVQSGKQAGEILLKASSKLLKKAPTDYKS